MGPSCCHGAEAVVSIPLDWHISGRDTEAPERPRDKGALCPCPSGLCRGAHRSRAPFTRSLAIVETAAGCRKEHSREGTWAARHS